ncbi:MAG: transglutaminase-like domain-containing protein [Defluviitaleaceae bacterium]|nr:transglutaminase-like domain-containing protein [Defluviitaleaceae bacterium]
MRRILGKALFAVIFLLLGASTVSLAALAMGAGQNHPVRERVVIEAGEEIPPVWAFLADQNPDGRNQAEFITDMSVFSQANPLLGEFVIEISFNRKTYASILKIADTVLPTGNFVNQLSMRGEQIEPESFVRDIRDATRVTVSYYQPVDFDKPGEQVVWVSLRDEGNNETLLCGYLYVLDGVRTVHREYGMPFEEISPGDFLFNETERASAAFITDVDGINFNAAGLYPIEMWVMEKVFVVYVSVADTLPPEAAAVEVTTYVGLPVEASEFVTDVFDHSPVDIYFAVTPDWDKPGEHIAIITLEDAFGNISLVEAALNIVPDLEPPVFYGLRTLYVVKGGTVAFRRGVTAIDGRDGEVEFTVDASEVDLSGIGTYYAYYEAADSSGNRARVPVQVVVTAIDPEEVYEMAQAVLDTIITEEMTDFAKANAIYGWIKRNIGYTTVGPKDDVITGAHNGLVRRNGDCYTFYATSALMLDMTGIPNITLQRDGGNNRHWWSLIDVGQGWHHFDATPHNSGDGGFHFTEARAQERTRARGASNRYYVYDPETLPPGVIVQ